MNTTSRHAVSVLTLLCLCAPAVDAATRYRIDPEASELRILVFRAGLFANLGHNHVVVTRALSGTAILGDTAADSSVSLEFPVQSLTVDEAAVRAEEGADFAGDVDADAIDGTRENLLGPKLLDAANHETIRIESSAIAGEFPNLSMTVRVTVKGEPHTVTVPVSVNTFDGGLVAIGRMRMPHAAIGLRPFEAALGSLRVAGEMLVKFRIRAHAPEPRS